MCRKSHFRKPIWSCMPATAPKHIQTLYAGSIRFEIQF